MRDNTNRNTPDTTGDEERDHSRDGYTPQQRRTINQGLRILARVAIRSYVRQRQGRSQAEDSEQEG